MKQIIIVICIFLSAPLEAKTEYPAWFVKAFKQLRLDEKYEINEYLKPDWLEADFNGDGNLDIATLIIEKKSRKKGILLIQKNGQHFILGAGSKFGNGGDNFKWANGWKIYTKKTAYETLTDTNGDLVGSKKIKLSKNALFLFDFKMEN